MQQDMVYGSPQAWKFQAQGTRVIITKGDCEFKVYLSRGMKYLMLLILNRDVPLRYLQLDSDNPEQLACYRQFNNESTLLESGLSVQDKPEVFRIADERTIREIKLRLLKIIDQLACAREYNDYALADELQAEQEILSQYLQEVYRPCGKLRNFPDASSKVKRRVLRAIHRALDDIRTESPALASTLEEALEMGEYLMYHSGGEEMWVRGL